MAERVAKSKRWSRPTASSPPALPEALSRPRPWLDDAWCRQRGEQPNADAAFLRGHACHVRGLFEEGRHDLLLAEAEAVEPWSTHAKAERWGPAAEAVFTRLEASFGLRTVAGRRFNVYQCGEGKPLHQDRNAHCAAAGNLTVTASFGAPRRLRLTPLPLQDAGQGAPSQVAPSAPGIGAVQRDGDVFCFTSCANAAYLHGIDAGPGARLSLVVWGDGESLEDVVARL